MEFLRVPSFALLAVALAACGSSTTTATCVPGRSEACACVDGTTGAQVCTDDRRFGECQCGAQADSGLELDAAMPPSDSGMDAAVASEDGGPIAGDDASAPIDAGSDAAGSDGGTRPRGHAVLFGWWFGAPDDAFDTMLENAIFLSERPTSTLRVVEYAEYGFLGWGDHARSVIDAAGASRGRTVTRTTFTSATGLATALASADVLFVPLQNADLSQMRTLAAFWREPLVGFLDAGGVVIVASALLGSSGGNEWALLDAPELFSLVDGRMSLPNNGMPVGLEVSATADPIAEGVLSPFSVRTSDVSLFSRSARGTVVVRTRDAFVPVVRHLVR